MFARKVDSAWEVHAPAKLNLYLEVLGRRDDGFHELETLMTPIRIFDRLRWEPCDASEPGGFGLAYDPSTPSDLSAQAPADQSNLVWMAFDRLGRLAGVEPTGRVTLVKQIPVQAGMGGASSDAAAALTLANAAWGLNYPTERLANVAAELGSDVPFFFAGGPAVCRGRGERVEPVACLPRLNLVVVKPPQGVSTADAFGELRAGAYSSSAACDSQGRLTSLMEQLQRGQLALAARKMVNRLQGAAARLCPWLERLRTNLERFPGLGWTMTGSGSAWFGVMRSAREARRIAGQLSSWNVGRVYVTASCRTASPPL
jgi:4-diphosphocytidyl-2-C-methyl-D-erythritol kinase